MATAKGKPRKRSLWQRLARGLGRRLRRGAVRGVRKLYRATVGRAVDFATREQIVKVASRDRWQAGYPDPTRHQPLVMTKVDPTLEHYEATFDGLLVVSFTIEPETSIALQEAAEAAAEEEHGPVAATWVLSYVEPMNDLARAAIGTGVAF